MLEFGWPLVLLLFPLPLIVRLALKPIRRDNAALRVPFFQQLTSISSETVVNTGSRTRISMVKILAALAWLALLLAAAKPLWIGDPVSLPTTGRDLMVAVDISGSMKQQDLTLDDEPVTRLEVVKKVLGDFIAERKGDRIGLILFGTQAYLQAPLTFDRNTVETLLDESQIGFAGEKTAIGDAIGLATKRLRKRPEASRLLIVLTDGANTAGEVTPEKATEIAKSEQIKIHTIGVGATEMSISPFGGVFGQRTLNPSADLDEKLLQHIAGETGGRFFRARDTQELQQIYAVLDQIEPVDQEAEKFIPIRSLYFWPLSVFVIFSLLILGVKLYPVIKSRLYTHKNGELADA